MKRNRKAQVGTAAAILVLAAIAIRTRTQPSPGEPQDAVYAMFNAARVGDVRAYLASYTPSMQATLRESGGPDFARYLRDSNADVKGVTVSDPQTITDQEVTVRVEYVYQDRNEAQVLHLMKFRERWKISGVSGEERLKTLIPYGTPVK